MKIKPTDYENLSTAFDEAYTFGWFNRESMGIMTQPRGIRNKNPGNIKHGDKWQGLAPEQPDDTFCTFTDPVWGIRAIFKILQTYRHKHGIDTVRKIIKRWAPSSENDTKRYAKFVASAMDVNLDEKLEWDEHLMTDLAKAICIYENGRQEYDADVYADAWRKI